MRPGCGPAPCPAPWCDGRQRRVSPSCGHARHRYCRPKHHGLGARAPHPPPLSGPLGGGRRGLQGDREVPARRHLLGRGLRRRDARGRSSRRQRLLPGLQPGDDAGLHRGLRRLGARAAAGRRLPRRDPGGRRRTQRLRLPHRLRLGPRDHRHDLGAPRLPLQGPARRPRHHRRGGLRRRSRPGAEGGDGLPRLGRARARH